MRAKKAVPTRAAPGLGGVPARHEEGDGPNGRVPRVSDRGRKGEGVGGLGRAGLDWAAARFWAAGRKRKKEEGEREKEMGLLG